MLYIIKWFYAWLLPPGLFLLVALAMLFLSYKTKKKFWLIVPLLVIYLLSIRPVSSSIIKLLENYNKAKTWLTPGFCMKWQFFPQ